MAIYHYRSPSLLDEVSVVTNENGGRRAYLHASENASAEALAALRQELKLLGWKSVPTVHEGKPVLEVRGFTKEQDFLQQALSHAWVSAELKKTPIENDKRDFRTRLESATLKATGIAYNVGDVAFMSYTLAERGYYKGKLQQAQALPSSQQGRAASIASAEESVKGSKLKIGAGIGYALGGIILSTYASRDQSQHQIKLASQKLNHFFRTASVTPGDDSALKDATHEDKKGLFAKAHALLTHYPSEALNLVYIGVGALLAMSSIKQIRAGQKPHETALQAKERIREEKWDIGLGAITATSALAGLTIPEKKPDEDQEKRTGIGGIIDWVREKPLRATGYGFMLATAFHAKATYGKWRNGAEEVKSTIKGRAGFVVMNVLAEVLMALSSKGHGVGLKSDESVDKTIISVAADMVLRQPAEKRDAMIGQLAGYLAGPTLVGGKPEDIQKELTSIVMLVGASPWGNGKPSPAPAFSGGGTHEKEGDTSARPTSTIHSVKSAARVVGSPLSAHIA